MLTFAQPWLLLLLLPALALIFWSWRRMSLPFSRRQRRFILASRLLLFTLIISALAGAGISLPVSRQAVVFVGDISASTSAQRAFMEQWITNAIRRRGPDDQVGIVAVGRNALVEQSLSAQVNFSQFQSAPDTNYTDLAAGLRLAAAMLPDDSERRIVLLSDGQQNLGDALQEAQLLRQEGIRLDIVPLPSSVGPEARIDDLNAPGELQTNERFLLRLNVFSSLQQAATLQLYLDHSLLLRQSVTLVSGDQEIDFSLLAPPPGFHTYRMTLEAQRDTLSQNNEASAFVNVQGPPQALIVEGQPGEGANIVNALHATGIKTTVGTPNDVPSSLDGLAAYSCVVLADVPAVELGTQRMQVLQSFARDLGRGLVVSGGPNSYGVGGYAGTPLEQALPVNMDIPQHKDTPSIAVVLIIEDLESNTGVNISKEAAKGVINLLTPRDQVGISAAYGRLAIPMQHVTNRAALDKAIDAMQPNDPESYLPDLVNAENVLLHTDAKIKHVILLGDGDAFDNYIPQSMKMASEHITISTVATNSQSYDELNTMIQIAQAGKGRFYRADDPHTIPQILLKETRQAARRAIIDEPFVPAVVSAHPLLTGLGPLPTLTGYVATTPKPAAQQVLVSHLDDPVLAAWQYGLGRVVAWTSDASGTWTARWLAWGNAARFWANLVTWTLPSPDSQLDVNTSVTGGAGQVTVDLPPGVQAPTSGQQQVSVSIVMPDLSRQTVTLQPGAPGRWQGSFAATQVGVYLLHVTWQENSGGGKPSSLLTSTTGLVVPYSPEYLHEGTDQRFLALLAQAGGGSLLGAGAYAAAFSANLPPVSASISIAFWLLALAALLLPIDVGLRRLAGLEFLSLLWKKEWRGRAARRGQDALPTEGEGAANAMLGATLNIVRAGRREREAGQAPGKGAPEPLREHRSAPAKSPLERLQEREAAPDKSAREVTAAVVKEKRIRPGTAPEGTAEASVAEKLLQAKRRRQETRPRDQV